MFVVIDTNVLVAALRSKRGASFKVLSRLGTGAFDIAISVPLVLEYESALTRQLPETAFTEADIQDLLDYICLVAKRQSVFFLWRPLLKDPKDDMVAEVAAAAGCEAVVTFNRRHFHQLARFGMRIIPPADLLRSIGAL